MCKKRVVILGAGLAGLSCALELAKFKKYNIVLLEKQSCSGGLAKSIKRDGFVFDIGPHRLHSKKKWILDWSEKVLKDYNIRLIKRKRQSRIFIKNRFFDWPLNLKQALTAMPAFLSCRAVWDYFKTEAGRRLSQKFEELSYEDWVMNRFGRTIYEIFFKDYNEKLWGLPAQQISVDWAMQRISLPSLKEAVLQSLFKKRNQSRTNLASFFYPQRGGIGSLAQAIERAFLEKGGVVMHNFHIQKIKIARNGRGVLWGKEKEKERLVHFDLIISSIPLINLIRYFTDTPLKIQKAVQNLKWRSLVCVNLVLKKESVSNDHWIYFPSKEISFNRLSEPKNFSLNNSKRDKTGLCVEITCAEGDKVWQANKESLVHGVINKLKKLDFIEQEEDVEDSFIVHESYAYPVYNLKYRNNLKLVKDYIKKKGVILIGRNGIFQYNNMDHSLAMGISSAQKIEQGKVFEEERIGAEYLG